MRHNRFPGVAHRSLLMQQLYQLEQNSNHTGDDRIASASRDTIVQVWSASNGTYLFTYSGHADQIEATAWSPDGTRLVSGSLDKTAQVWNASSGNLLRTYRGHTNWVLGVSWPSMCT